MKIVKYNFLLLLGIILCTMSKVQSQQIDVKIQNQNIRQFIQIWGLVKYKSQKSINGKFDADQMFLSLIDSVKNADAKQFNRMMLDIIGPVDPLLTAASQNYNFTKLNSNQYLFENVDFKWIKDKRYTIALRKQLDVLSQQINLSGKHQYIPAVWYESDIPNEAPYETYAFDQEKMNLLSLAKIWNAVEYLFPYKYMMDKDWERILIDMVPVFRKINNRTSYEKGILMLAVAINDTHGVEFMEVGNMKMINDIFNIRYYPPFDYKSDTEGIIVKKFLNDSLASKSSLKIGDVIVAINGENVEHWLNERSALLPASNQAVKYRELSASDNNRGDTFAFSDLKGGTLDVKIRRDRTFMELKLEMLDRQNKGSVKMIQNYILQKRAESKSIKGLENIGDDIVIIRAGYFFEKDLPEDDELTKLSLALKSKKAIIFDMRKYPQAPGLFSYYLPLVLGKTPFAFARYYSADLKNPGVFIHRAEIENYMHIAKDGPKAMGELYTGKIVILTNEGTQSLGEWFTMMLSQLNNNTTIIGSQTAGADGDVKRLTLPGAYRFSFTGNGVFYPDGTETQRVGIKPDIYFKPSAKELSGVDDAQLQRALRFIRHGN